MFRERFRFGGECKPNAAGFWDRVLERLFAHRVAGAEEQFLSPVVNDERKHPFEFRYTVEAVLVVEVKDRLSVAARLVADAGCFEFAFQWWMVVDLAVVDDGRLAAGAVHRLGAAGDVDDA